MKHLFPKIAEWCNILFVVGRKIASWRWTAEWKFLQKRGMAFFFSYAYFFCSLSDLYQQRRGCKSIRRISPYFGRLQSSFPHPGRAERDECCSDDPFWLISKSIWKNQNALPSSLGKIKVIKAAWISFSQGFFSRCSVSKPDDPHRYLEMYFQYLLLHYWMDKLRFSIVCTFLFGMVFLVLISEEERTLRSQKGMLEQIKCSHMVILALQSSKEPLINPLHDYLNVMKADNVNGDFKLDLIHK